MEQAYLYDKAIRIKEFMQQEKCREFHRIRALQELDKDIKEYPRELRSDPSKHPMQWSEALKRTFSTNISAYLP